MFIERSCPRRRGEAGQTLVIFALALPMFLALCGFVLGIGNWYVHGKHLQTKADAGAIAGGTAWEFPCGPTGTVDAIDQRIASYARLYAGSNNPQVGGVPNSEITSVLNGPAWYDDDSNPSPSENLDICQTMSLDVKVTEDNSFPLASLIPLFPDIKRKAVVQLFEAEGATGLLPIAVRAPEPVTTMAIFYNENSGAILGRKYLVKDTSGTIQNLPGGLQGWTTENTSDPQGGWADVQVAAETGVVIAISFRGACNTFTAPDYPSGPPAGITVQTGPGSSACFEDGLGVTDFPSVNALCNQGGAVQIANCYFATGTFPNEAVQSGLHYIRGYQTGSVTDGPPELRSAYLAPGNCAGGYGSGYFASFPNVCSAVLNASVDAGTCFRVRQGAGWTGPCVPTSTANSSETRTGANVDIKYTIVHGTGNPDDTCDFGNTCGMSDGDGTAGGPINANVGLTLPANRTRQMVALQIRLKETFVAGRPACSNTNFSGSCEWYFLGSGRVLTEPTNAEIWVDPVTRAFRGNTINAASIRFLRLKADRNPCSSPARVDEFAFGGEEGSHPLGGTSCFVVQMGLKGGLATDADNEPILFSDGVGSSQMGYIDCTSSGPQNIVDELMKGCPPLYAPNKFNTNPVCPTAANLFTLPNPGSPFDNGDWPPLRCIKTRPSSQGSDLIKGLNGRFFEPGSSNPGPNMPNQCPGDPGGPDFVHGRNYWKHDATTNPTYGYAESDGSWLTHFDPRDPRLVTIFLTTSEAFTGSGQNSYPVVGAIAVYITGVGRIGGGGALTPEDPCAGPPPSDYDASGGSAGGRVVWGHIINRAILSAGATPSPNPCNPGGSVQVCVPVLVE